MKPLVASQKAEQFFYKSTTTVSSTVNSVHNDLLVSYNQNCETDYSKELDGLAAIDFFMERRDEDYPIDVGNLLEGTEEIKPFKKEDMTAMLNRALLEKTTTVEEPRTKYNCFVCDCPIEGRCITARGKKFMPECFVCSYCRGPFRNRKFKTDPTEGKPYCLDCFDKLFGHF